MGTVELILYRTFKKKYHTESTTYARSVINNWGGWGFGGVVGGRVGRLKLLSFTGSQTSIVEKKIFQYLLGLRGVVGVCVFVCVWGGGGGGGGGAGGGEGSA